MVNGEDKFHEMQREVELRRLAPKMLGVLRAMRLELQEPMKLGALSAERGRLRRLREWVDRGLEGTEDL